MTTSNPTLLAADAPPTPVTPTSRPALAPGQVITWSMPELPPTLYSIVEDKPADPLVTVYLPADYAPDRKFPLAVFVSGAHGSAGDHAGFARSIVGDTGYICVGLPSFKGTIEPLKEDKSNYWSRMFIRPSEGPCIWRSYKLILEKLYREIPNIDREQSVFGGFSNGAHIAAAFLSNPDEAQAFLTYFRRFVLVEGATQLKPATDLTGVRILLMRGGAADKDILRNVKPALDAAGATWTEHVMPNVGHDYPPDAKAETRKWIESTR